ncbi:type III pantothenate kinase, partial [Alphaproteobacteria bacterium]|nr:type III pantothenate kinase [Alphaproteobacteria bacterium]
MLLAVDCGNTNIVMSVFDDEAICCQWRLETKGPHSGKAYLDVLTQQLTKISCSPQDIDGCVIASVVPDITPHLSSFATNILGVVPVIVGAPGVTLALEIDIDNPAEVGADRLVNAVAVAHLGLVPAIVVDFGTATTFDIVRTAQTDKHKACYAGGVISPGVHRSSEALAMA